MVTSRETSAINSRKYAVEQSMNVSNFSKTITFFGHPSQLLSSKNSFKHAKFSEFFTFKGTYRVHSFQENMYLNKIRTFQIYQKHLHYFGCQPRF